MRYILLLAVSAWVSSTIALYAEPSPTLQPSRYSFQLTHILTKDGKLKTGWLLGTYGDTLVAQIGKNSDRISRRDLVRVDVERPPQKGASTLAGVFMGVYVGSALTLKANNQPFLFMRENNEGELALVAALFGLVGGVIGNLVAGAAGNVAIFDFPEDEAANAAAWVGTSSSMAGMALASPSGACRPATTTWRSCTCSLSRRAPPARIASRYTSSPPG